MVNGSITWDLTQIWAITDWYLTLCSPETLMSIPCAFLWLALPYEIFTRRKDKTGDLVNTLVRTLLLVLSVILCCLSLLEHLWSSQYLFDELDIIKLLLNNSKLPTFILSLLLTWIYKPRILNILRLFWALLSFFTFYSCKNEISALTTWNFHNETSIYLAVIPVSASLLFFSFFAESKSDTEAPSQNKCPKRFASFFSKLTFSWFTPLARLGMKRKITSNDLWELDESDQAEATFKNFLQQWGKIEKGRDNKNQELNALGDVDQSHYNFGVFKALLRVFLLPILSTTLFALARSFSTFLNPVTLNHVISFMSSDEPTWKGCSYAALMFTSSCTMSILNTHFDLLQSGIYKKIQTCLGSVIYRKCLRVCGPSLGKYSTGEIINLSRDASRAVYCLGTVHSIWSAPLEIFIALYLLWGQLGAATLFGFVILIMLLPVESMISRHKESCWKSEWDLRDKGMKLLTEMFGAIKVLKLFAWETFFAQKVTQVRNQMKETEKSLAFIRAFSGFIYSCSPIFVSLASFAGYVLLDENNVLDAKKVFVSLSLFDILEGRLSTLRWTKSSFSECMVSIRRINEFLQTEELKTVSDCELTTEKHAILVKNASFTWKKDAEATLEEITFKVQPQKLVAVVGQVGSGKSSLLSAILGEMNNKCGTVNVSGRVAYVSQQAWIQNQTLRENILFTRPMEEERYKRVLKLCALEPDLEVLQGGDLCKIGEKGINLSGGQKQRVSLARAVYFDADLYLLDDPLSAVDAHVSRKLFDNVIGPRGILKKKTRILVTHRLTVLPHVDEIFVLKNGKISEHGTYSELLAKDGEFAEILRNYVDQDHSDDAGISGTKEGGREKTKRATSCSQDASETEKESIGADTDQNGSVEELNKGQPLDGKDEINVSKSTVFKECIVLMGSLAVITSLVYSFISPILDGATRLWLAAWSGDGDRPESSDIAPERSTRLIIYALLGIAQACFVLVSDVILYRVSTRGGERLYNSMLNRVTQAPMSFYETTPVGQILGRFSEDASTANHVMRYSLRGFFQTLLSTTFSLLLVCYKSPLVATTLVPLGYLYYSIQRYKTKVLEQMYELNWAERSPKYTHISESVTGAHLIRAYGVGLAFEKEYYRRIDNGHRASYASDVGRHWFSIRMEFLSDLLVFFVALFAVLYRGTISPGLAGLTITYAMTISSGFASLIYSCSSLESDALAIGKCLEYCNAPIEEPEDLKKSKQKEDWPREGRIRYSNYSTRYRPGLPLVLKDICCEIKPGEKVGIVGRTGSGKSTFSIALFRIIEPTDGTIFIDGVDITSISLQDLRSRLTIIPQDPVLFTGTLRSNLDPVGLVGDEALWKALRAVQMEEFVSSLECGLNHQIIEGGENLSVGQRQLICMARAILRSSRVLILDEATAAVDYETDAQIQRTIRVQFESCTVITIAHRLNTVIDYDRILALDNGQLVEFDSPKNLLNNSKSLFYSMAKDSGLV